jgi:hypothetical protein
LHRLARPVLLLPFLTGKIPVFPLPFLIGKLRRCLDHIAVRNLARGLNRLRGLAVQSIRQFPDGLNIATIGKRNVLSGDLDGLYAHVITAKVNGVTHHPNYLLDTMGTAESPASHWQRALKVCKKPIEQALA